MELKDATCRTCSFGRQTTGLGGDEVKCQRSPEPLSKKASDWCGEHPLRQRDRLAARLVPSIIQGWSGSMAPDEVHADDVVTEAYSVADALLRQCALKGAGHA